MFFGLALQQEVSIAGMIIQSLFQGMAGALLVCCALAVFRLSMSRLN